MSADVEIPAISPIFSDENLISRFFAGNIEETGALNL